MTQLRIVPIYDGKTTAVGTFAVMDTSYCGTYEVFRGSYQECYDYINPQTIPDYNKIIQLHDKL